MVSKGSFGYNLTTGGQKQVIRAPITVAAMYDNFAWVRSLFQPLNFSNTMQFFSRKSPKPLTRKQKALTYYPTLQEAKWNETIQKNERKTDETIEPSDIGQTRSHTDYFKANRKRKPKNQTKQLPEEEKQTIIKQAQCDALLAITTYNLAAHKGEKLDEIFIEVVSKYKDQDPETFGNIFNSVFNIVYFQNMQLHEVLESDEISEVLEILKIPQPVGQSSLLREDLQEQVRKKQWLLLKLVSDIFVQPSSQPENISHEDGNPLPNQVVNPSPEINKAPPATNIAFKSSLKTVFSSKETYFCLFWVAASISMLCLWHLPMGKVSILKELVPPKGRESIGLTLNIELPILIALCVFSLAYFIYSEYSAESKQVSKNDLLSRTQ